MNITNTITSTSVTSLSLWKLLQIPLHVWFFPLNALDPWVVHRAAAEGLKP